MLEVEGQARGVLEDDFPLVLCMPAAADICEFIRTSVESTSASLSRASQSACEVPARTRAPTCCPVCQPRRDTLERAAAACVKLAGMVRDHSLLAHAPLPCLSSACMKLVMVPLWPVWAGREEHPAWPTRQWLGEQDRRLQRTLVSLSFLQAAHVEGLPATLCSSSSSSTSAVCSWPWRAAGRALQDMSKYRAPHDKVAALLNASRILQSALAGASHCPCPVAQGDGGAKRTRYCAADALIPALLYTCLHAGHRLSALATDIHVMTAGLSLQSGVVSCSTGVEFTVPADVCLPPGEEGYTLTALLSTLTWIQGAGRGSFNVQGMTDEEWEERKERAVEEWRKQGVSRIV